MCPTHCSLMIRHLLADGSFAEVSLLATGASLSISDNLDPLGMTSNKNMEEMLIRFFGSDSLSAQRSMLDLGNGGARTLVRYLGPHISWSGSAIQEVILRVQAASKAWYAYRGFWRASADKRFRRLVYRAIVISTLFSGLPALVLNKTCHQHLDRFLYKFGKELMGVEACSLPEGATRHRAQTFLQVARFSTVADSRTEMRVQRLQWYQDVARHPNSNRLLITAWYG